MPRQKGDGRGRLGGRQKGTPNDNNPLKGYLREHSIEYFEPRLQVEADGKSPRKIFVNGTDKPIILADNEGKPLVMSDFKVDVMMMEPADRVMAELKVLKYHTPEMKSVDIDMDVHGTVKTIEDKLKDLYDAEEETEE